MLYKNFYLNLHKIYPMKNLFFCIMLTVVGSATAQMGMGNGMGGGMNGMGGGMNGMGGGMGGRMNGPGGGLGNQQIPQSETKPEKIDYVKMMIDKLEKDLGLDTLQKTIIRQAFDEGNARMQSIIDSKISDEMKELKINEIKDNNDKRILQVLNKGQIEKYNKLKEKGKKK